MAKYITLNEPIKPVISCLATITRDDGTELKLYAGDVVNVRKSKADTPYKWSVLMASGDVIYLKEAEYEQLQVAIESRDDQLNTLIHNTSHIINQLKELNATTYEVDITTKSIDVTDKQIKTNTDTLITTTGQIKTNTDTIKGHTGDIVTNTSGIKSNTNGIKDVLDSIKTNTTGLKGVLDNIKSTTDSINTWVRTHMSYPNP